MSSPKTVDQYLDTVSYGYDPDYRPSLFALKFVNFIKLMTDGKGESSPTPVMHYRMLDLLPYATSVTDMQRIANLASRGTAKTSIFAEILFFYIAVFGEIDNFGKIDAIIYVSDTIENGVRSLKKNMEARYDQSEFLQEHLPRDKITFNQTEIYMVNIDGVKTGIRMFGAATGLRGTKILGKRPQLAVLDDLLSDKNAKSDGIIENINDTLYKGVNHALDPTQRKIIFSGTPFHAGDPLYVAIGSGAWTSNVFPVCERFPCSEGEFRGAWEERFTYDYVRAEYDAMVMIGQVDSFYQELMLQITSADDRLIEESDIHWYDRSQIFANKDKYNVFITTDFATSAAKGADPSAISVWFVNDTKHLFWVDGILKRQGMGENINDLFRFVRKYAPISVGIEINGQQGGFIPWIKQEMINRDTFFSLAKTIGVNGKATRVGVLSGNDSNKLERFNVMVPDIRIGKLHLPQSMVDREIMQEAVKQLLGATKKGLTSRNDDWLDTYSMMGMIEVFGKGKTSSTGFVEETDEYDEEYRRYFKPPTTSSSNINSYVV